MSDDYISGTNTSPLSDFPDSIDKDDQEVASERKKQEMIDLLKQARDELEKSPSLEEFQSLEFEISGYLIKKTFGTWNNAKRAAGLETYKKGEGGHTRTEINKDYFKNIDTPQKAYWLGTLISTSCITTKNNADSLVISRVNKPFFIKQFSKAVESDYSISEHKVVQNGKIKTDFQTHIQNSTFIDHLKSAGHPDGDNNSVEIRELKKSLRPPFVRGYLESSGYFGTSGWEIPVGTDTSAERLRQWFKSFGAKRPTVGKRCDRPVVRVANIFDIRSVFETCWAEGTSTEPSYSPYPRKILDYLNSKYPYPENVNYLKDNM